jgi:hypothetical protein
MKTLVFSAMLCCVAFTVNAESPARDAALRDCNEAAIKKWSYRGTPYDKSQQRDFYYQACMARLGQMP